MIVTVGGLIVFVFIVLALAYCLCFRGRGGRNNDTPASQIPSAQMAPPNRSVRNNWSNYRTFRSGGIREWVS